MPTKRKTIKKRTTKKQASGGLYQSSRRSPSNYRPVYYTVGDTHKAVTQYDRLHSVRIARSVFTNCPDLGGALIQKSSWCVGPGAFTPIYTGTDTAWGDQAEEWLTTQFFPVCSTAGQNFPFSTILNLSSLALDVDGDTAMALTSTREGFPQITLIASHRIGQRKNEKLVEEGRFSGYRICDGVILNDNGRVIGYRILGDTEDDDLDVSSANLQLLIEPEWADQYRGISRVARSVTDWQSQDEINEFLLRGVKLASSIGLIHRNESGDGQDSGFMPGANEDITAPTSGVQVTNINGGEMYFMKAGIGEGIEALKDERPSQNTEAFISRIQKRALYSIGWPQEMLDSSKIGGAAVRLVQDLVRRSVATRQQTLERRARLIVNYGIAKAVKEGFLPPNDNDWFKWTFTKGGVVTVDGGNEASADREGFKLGVTSLTEISAKKGVDWYELRQQTQKETEDLLDRATILSKKYGITLDAALVLLSQRTPNSAPVTQLPTEQPLQQEAA